MLLAVVVLLNLPLPVASGLAGGTRDGMVPFQNVFGFLVNRGRAATLILFRAGHAAGERQEMLREIATLRHELRRLQIIETDNVTLREQLGFKQRQKHKLLLCEVVSRGDTTGWWQAVRLNRGARDGVKPNLAVITTEGVLGRTMAVSLGTCDVLLLSDPNSKVACKFSRTSAIGIVKGLGVDLSGDSRLEMLSSVRPCHMDYISKDHETFEGDEIVTSGLGGVFPEGLVMGRVMRSGPDPSGLYQRAEVSPSANLTAFRYAFVVVD